MKTLNDPEELRRIKDIYEEPIYTSDLTNEELMDQQRTRARLSTNQAK